MMFEEDQDYSDDIANCMSKVCVRCGARATSYVNDLHPACSNKKCVIEVRFIAKKQLNMDFCRLIEK